jgi:glutaredoxin
MDADNLDTRLPASLHAVLRAARALGLARGVLKKEVTSPRPERALELYSYEACPRCRRVRQTLTELDLDFLHRSCPVGSVRAGACANRQRLVERGGKMQVPYLVDPNSGAEMYESDAIIDYLTQHYGHTG